MATVTGMTAERMLAIEAASVVDGDVVGDNLVLTKHDGSTIDAGDVRGPAGAAGAPGAVASVAQEAWHIVGAAGEPAFQNGNVWYGAFEKPAFRKTPDGVVKLRGVIKGTGTVGAIFTLPAGYRPSGIRIFSSRGTFGAGPVEQSARIDIATNGDVTPQSAIPASGFLSLELEFDVDPTTFPAGKSIIPVVTALPAGPTHGDEIYFQTAAMKVDGLMWHLRYDATAPGAYKWIAIGSQTPLFAEDPTDRSLVTNRSLYQALGGGSNPTLALPLAGDYMVALGARAYMSIGNSVWLSYDIGATAAVDADAAWGVYNGAASPSVDNISRLRRKTGLAAVTLTMKARANTDADGAFSNRWFSATPVRVG